MEGLDEWVTALDQIGEADWSTLETYGESALRRREGDSITGAACLGGYLLVRQDFSSEMVNTHNILYVAYKVQAQLPDGSSLSYYAAIGFTDLVLHGDGSVEATSDSGYAAYGKHRCSGERRVLQLHRVRDAGGHEQGVHRRIRGDVCGRVQCDRGVIFGKNGREKGALPGGEGALFLRICGV